MDVMHRSGCLNRGSKRPTAPLKAAIWERTPSPACSEVTQTPYSGGPDLPVIGCTIRVPLPYPVWQLRDLAVQNVCVKTQGVAEAAFQ